MNLDNFLLPISSDSPCGPDLEYDPDFLSLEELVRLQPGQEFRRDDGQTIAVEASETRWPAVLEQSQALFGRSKDLRVAVLLIRSLLHLEGYSAIAGGLNMILHLLQDYWVELHPCLDPDDGDPTMRLNAIAALNASDSVLGDIRSSYIFNSRQHGKLRVRELEIALGRLEPGAGETKLAAAELQGLLNAALDQVPELAGQAAAALRDLDALVICLREQIGSVSLPDLSGLRKMLEMVAIALGRASGTQASEQSDELIQARSDPSSPDISRDEIGSNVPGGIHSRDDVARWLEILCAYLERNEPTNPVQILLRRAQRMMNMNFLELMQDMAPDGLEQAEKVVGRKLDDGDE